MDNDYSHPTSRTKMSLDTGPGEDDHYDQICALSAQTINDNFQALWDLRGDEMSPLNFDDSEHGVLTGKLLCPQVMIDPNQGSQANPCLHYLVRFGPGSSIYYNERQQVDISGWVVAVSAALEEICVTPVEGDSQGTLAEKAAHREPMKAQFALTARGDDGQDVRHDLDASIKIEPGEYGIHRLFVAISANSWSKPVKEFSTCPNPNGGDMLLEDWHKVNKENEELMQKIKETLSAWAETNRSSPFFTLGLRFKEPKPALGKEASDICVPFAMGLLTYPHISPDTYDNKVKSGQVPEGDIQNEYNCLVFAETTGHRDLPAQKSLHFRGNLASPVSFTNTKEVLGTFVLDHRNFLHSQILVFLQEMCMGCMVVALDPELTTDGGCSARFSVGAPPAGVIGKSGKKPAALASDEYYSFKLVEPRTYKWEEEFVAPGSKKTTYAHTTSPLWPIYTHWNTWSKQQVTVTWEPAGHEFLVKGRTFFHHWQAQANHPDFPFDDMWPQDGFFGDYTLGADWSFKIDLKVTPTNTGEPNWKGLDYGVIEPTIEGLIDDPADKLNGLPKDTRFRLIDERYDIAKGWEASLDRLRTELRQRVQHVSSSLAGRFRGTGRFVYPGTGALSFGPPKIADNGDIYADVDYVPPTNKELITIRKPDKMPFLDPLYRKLEIISVEAM